MSNDNPWGDICKRIRTVMEWNQEKLGLEIYGNYTSQKLVSHIEGGRRQPNERERAQIWRLMQDMGQKGIFPGVRPSALIQLYMRDTDPRSACEFILFAVTDPGFRATLTEVYVYLSEDPNAVVPFYVSVVLVAGGIHYIVDTARIHFNHKDDFGGLVRVANNRTYETIPMLDGLSERFPGATFIEAIADGSTPEMSGETEFPLIIRTGKKVALRGFEQVRDFLKQQRPNANV